MLEDEAISHLPQYSAILDHRAEPKYLVSRKVPVDAALDAPSDALWQVHQDAIGSDQSGLRKTGDGRQNSLFDLKLELARRMLSCCELCERRCKADRKRGSLGHCKVGESRISSQFIHWGEEPELVPSYTVFFAGCTFNCVFCQNWDISQFPASGERVEPRALARTLERREGSVLNINWVGGDPTSNLPYILEVLSHCDLHLPQVWNSNMYLTGRAMSLLDGVVDLYLSDFKYGNDECARRLSGVKNFFAVCSRNHLVANHQCDLIIRHLVMPNHVDCCSIPVLDWIARNLDTSRVRVNVMAQYRPEYKAHEHEDIAGPLRMSEFRRAYEHARMLGLSLCR